jgi:heme-degrading monooxygenase HmoA
MAVVRMWETRLDAASVQPFWAAVRATWRVLASYDGFLGGEAFAAATDEHRAVVLTRWRDEPSAGQTTAWEAALDTHTLRPGHGWFFTPVPVIDAHREP